MNKVHPILGSEYLMKDEIEITVNSATEFWLCNLNGDSFYLKRWTTGWVIQFQESFFCKDKTFNHKNDIPSFIHSHLLPYNHNGGGNDEWPHLFRTKEEAVELFRTRDLPNLPSNDSFYHKVYDILEDLGGATGDGYRDSFVYNYTKDKYKSDEWRFQGKLGFGGKYRGERNVVDCYTEDENPERRRLIKKINAALKKLQNERRDQNIS